MTIFDWVNQILVHKKHWKQNLELIDKIELREILEMYGKDKKTIKRLCK